MFLFLMSDAAVLSHFYSFSLETNENFNATATEIIKIKLFTTPWHQSAALR